MQNSGWYEDLNVEDFKSHLLASETKDVSHQLLSGDTNWYFDECDEVDHAVSYNRFRAIVADHVGLQVEQIALVGSTVFGFSLSPKDEKTFANFHDESDLDLVIVSEVLFSNVWQELLEAYHRGYGWVMHRHSNEIFRKFALLINNGNYKTSVLRQRAKMLDGISKQVYLKTGSTRSLKYRIYQSYEAAVDYHSSGLAKIKRRLEVDA